METIGQRMRQWGLSRFGSIKAFSEAIGVSTNNIHKYLNDENKPGADMLIRMNRHGCDLPWLLNGGLPPVPDQEVGKLRDALMIRDREIYRLKIYLRKIISDTIDELSNYHDRDDIYRSLKVNEDDPGYNSNLK